jgi:hypothetical protein
VLLYRNVPLLGGAGWGWGRNASMSETTAMTVMHTQDQWVKTGQELLSGSDSGSLDHVSLE